jgi:hypothetical protein
LSPPTLGEERAAAAAAIEIRCSFAAAESIAKRAKNGPADGLDELGDVIPSLAHQRPRCE